jgi:hypothetical protein
LFFYKSPTYLINELADNKSVLITEHRYSKMAEVYEQKRAGRFCVQFITFTNTQESQSVLNTWKNQCIDWCFAKYEDGKFGDQKYLDEWPSKYPNIHILENLGGGIAPWNVQQYDIFEENDTLYGIEKKTNKKFEVIFFHFHFVRFIENQIVDIGWHHLQKNEINILYKPYIKNILHTEYMLRNLNSKYKTIGYSDNSRGVKEFLKKKLKQFSRYNLINLTKL